MQAERILIDNEFENTKFFSNPSFDDALVGITDDGRAVYDRDKMVKWMSKHDGISEEDAEEFISYNTIRSLLYMGDDAPIVFSKLRK